MSSFPFISNHLVRPGKVAYSSGGAPRPGKAGRPPGSESLEGGE